MKTVLETAPSLYPVTLAQAKSHMNIESTFTADDTYIRALIATATDKAEQFLRRRLISQTWKVYLDDWPDRDYFYLPYGALQSVTHIKYKDTDAVQTTWGTDEYIVDTESATGRIVLAYGYTWPTTTLYPSNPIEIQFTCGYYAGSEWEASTSYSEDDIIIPTALNGLTYQAGGDGTSNSTEPTWPLTIGGTVVDNDITWTCAGRSVPFNIVSAIKLIVSDLYENRESMIIGQGLTPVNLKTANALMWPYRIHEVL